MKTKTNIKFEMFDITAKEDSSVDIEDKQDFVDLSDLLLEAGELVETKYGTLEKNQFALDGTFSLMPDELDDMGLWSSSMTDENGDFETPPVLEVTFTDVHSSAGLTLVFSKAGDYCNYANVKYYDSNDNILADEDFFPDDYLYVYNLNVENYTKLIITFYSTNNPYRYLKLYRIDYGLEKNFTNDDIISANLLEEVDLLSSEISINTLEFTVYSEDDEFNLLNPTGIYEMLQDKQAFKVTKIDIENDTEKDMGTLYLDEWSYEKDKNMKFKAIDLIGVIDKTTFYGGMYEDVPFMDIMLEILESAGLDEDDCEIDEDIQNISMTGYIPVCTPREAIQQLAFAVCAIVDCSRSDKIRIYKIDNTEKEELTISRESDIFQNTREISQMDLVTGVAVTLHTYKKDEDEASEEKLGTWTLGDYGIYALTWDEPVYDASIDFNAETPNGEATIEKVAEHLFHSEFNCNSLILNWSAEQEKAWLALVIWEYIVENEIGTDLEDYWDGLYFSIGDFQEDTNTAIIEIRQISDTIALDWIYVNFDESTVESEQEGTFSFSLEDFSTIGITINGYKYSHTTSTYQMNATDIYSNKGDNVLEVDTAYFVTKDNMSTIAQNILDYYNESYEDKFEKVLEDESISSLINVDTEFDQNLQGNIKSIDIDLQGGFLGEITAISKVVDSSG